MVRPFLSTLILTALLLPGCGDGAGEGDEGVWPPNEAAIAAMNRGLAKLELFEYGPAAEEFLAALEICPDWIDAKVNLAVARLNERGEEAAGNPATGDYGATVRLCEEILEDEPGNPHANFIAGVVLLLQPNTERALDHFDRVLEVDPRDAATIFWSAKALIDLGRYEEADERLSKAIAIDPYQASAYYLHRTPLIRLGKKEEFDAALEAFQLLEPPPGEQWPIAGSKLTAGSYVEIGRYAMAVRDYRGAPDDHVPASVSFTRPEAPPFPGWAYGGEAGPELTGTVVKREGEADRDAVLRYVSRIGPGVALGDFDGDGDEDVFLPEWGGTGRLYRNDGRPRFADVTEEAGLSTPVHGISGVFFDADGDEDLDLYVAAAGPNVYYENRDGVFVDRTDAAGLAGGDLVSVSAVAGDFDHEGDIDLFVANYARPDDLALAGAPDALFQNDRTGTFTDVAGTGGVDGGDRRSLGMLPIDPDGDLDTDLLVIRDRQPAALWLNERVWNFRPGELPPELSGDSPAWGAAAGDIDRDGREEILVLRGPGAGAELFAPDERGRLHLVPSPLSAVRWRTAVFLDADLDGWVDLVGDDVVVLGEDGGPAGPIAPSAGALPEDARGAGFADLDGDGDLDRVWASREGAGVVATVAPEEHHWAAYDLVGRIQLQPVAWAAKVGPGQQLEMRAGRLWQPLRARGTSGFLSTIERSVRFGLGRHEKADILRILWPDRVLQVEAELPADRVREIVQHNRKPTSCPMIFAWDGRDFLFVTDFLGVGGLGFFVEPGVTGIPDPTEYVRIGKWAKPKDGHIVLQVMEPLEEITYLDEATLVVVDHPAGWDAWPNERFAADPALFPEDRIYAVAEKVFPRAARDIRGNDIRELLLEVDRDYAPIEPDRRFLGLAAEHAITLDFTDRVPEVGDGDRLVLFLDGAVEYGFSRTVFAAYQAGVPYELPRLEVPDGAGGWRTVIGNTGFPAGMPKGMTVDVTGVVTPESPVFRLRSNLEIFWDRAFLGVDRADEVRITRVPVADADLHHRGYPRDYSPDGGLPIVYDYGLMDPGYPMRNMAGDYTKLGNVTPLLTETDDMYVIMARGEEITLRWPVEALPELPEGRERTLILYTAGYCKDMDPYTAHPDTVEPLPFRAMSGYPYGEDEHYPDTPEHRRYREEWNTRRIYR